LALVENALVRLKDKEFNVIVFINGLTSITYKNRFEVSLAIINGILNTTLVQLASLSSKPTYIERMSFVFMGVTKYTDGAKALGKFKFKKVKEIKAAVAMARTEVD
jgi:hypothetical protein